MYILILTVEDIQICTTDSQTAFQSSLPFAEESRIVQSQTQTKASITSTPFNLDEIQVTNSFDVQHLPSEDNLQSTLNIEQLENLNLSSMPNITQELSDVTHLQMPEQVEVYLSLGIEIEFIQGVLQFYIYISTFLFVFTFSFLSYFVKSKCVFKTHKANLSN